MWKRVRFLGFILFGFLFYILSGCGNLASILSSSSSSSSADTTFPAIRILSPADNTVYSTNFTISGTAYDESGISSVEVKVGGGSFERASGTTNWSYLYSSRDLLDQGTSIVQVKAVDNNNNTSILTINFCLNLTNNITNNITNQVYITNQIVTNVTNIVLVYQTNSIVFTNGGYTNFEILVATNYQADTTNTVTDPYRVISNYLSVYEVVCLSNAYTNNGIPYNIDFIYSKTNYTYNNTNIVSVTNYLYPRNGLAGEWMFSGNADDTSGNMNNGVVNGAVLTEDRFGNSNRAYRFNGSNNYIRVSNSSVLTIQNSISLIAWVKHYSFSSPQHFINKDTYRLAAWSGNPTGYGFELYTPAQEICNESQMFLTNKWTLVAATWDGSKMRLYRNTNLQSTVDFTGSISYSGSDLFIGVHPWLDQGYFYGVIDDVMIYDRALSIGEIQEIYGLGGWTDN